MEEIYNIFSILHFIISGKAETQLERQEKICLKYAEGTVTDQTHHKRYVKFCGGGSLLDDAPR